MQMLSIHLDADTAWPDLKVGSDTKVSQAKFEAVALMEKGTVQGHPTVWVRLELPDGTVALGETTAKLFCSAARAFMAKHPGLLD